MDVTYGLLSTLVKTNSIQRILAPIASQISLLIILNESEDGSSLPNEDMVPCAQAVVHASNRLVMVAKQQAESSTDSEFIAQTLSSCEVLELSSSNLFIASERLEASGVNKEARNKLIQASKDVLQGTMKVLLVADDAEIRRLITASHILTDRLGSVSQVTTMPALVQGFKDFTEALSVLTGLADKRQRDLIHSRQREKIITSLNILKKSVSSLSTAMQNYVKYSSNPQAQAGKSFVVNEILTSVRDIVEAAQNRDSDQDEIVAEEPGKFVTNIDQALDSISEDKRNDLHGDLEMWVEEIVRHSMTVAHMCRDGHRDLIIKTCQRVIQVKNRLLDLKNNLTSDSSVPQMREDYGDLCEMLTDEFCELEKNVNISLLHLVVEHFKETTEPLERLVKRAVYSDLVLTSEDSCVDEFEDHAEKICQIASLAAASSTDSHRVYIICASIQRLEHLDPEIVPAAINISRNKHDKAAMHHLKLLMKEWTFELTNLIQVLDEMTDPKMFMLVSERCVEDDINSCNGCILIGDQKCFQLVLQAMIGRSRRVVTVAERIVDSSDDALFRNGLMVFVHQLKKAITAVRAAGGNLWDNLHNKALQDTLRRRFTFLQDSLIKVKQGLNEANHPHVLSPLRRNIRVTRELKGRGQEVEPPKKTMYKWRYPSGDPIIATSVPKLPLSGSPIEENIVPKLETRQRSQPTMVKSQSLAVVSQSVPVTPNTYAWKLVQELVTWCTKGDKQKVNGLCGDLLGWTNHIAEVFMSVKQHSRDVGRKSEAESVCGEVDELTPKILEEAKYVLHGDFSLLNSLKSHTEDWATKMIQNGSNSRINVYIEKVRVFVDITVEKWKSLTDSICEACQSSKVDLIKHQLKLVQDHQEALLDLVMITERFRWENQVKRQILIESLMEDKNDLENLTVTLKTTSEMTIDNNSKTGTTELEQLGREWSVKLFTMVTRLEAMVEDLFTLAKERKLWTCIETCDNLIEYLQEEIKQLKDLLKSACYGNEEKKDLYQGYLADMRDCVEDIKTVSLKKSTSSIVTTQYSSIKLGLYRGYWILKAIHCVDLARQQTSMYCGSIDVLVERAFTFKAVSVSDRDRKEDSFKELLSNFTDKSIIMRKKVLQSIQMSTELEKRSMVRQCLDAMTTLTPQVVALLNTFAGSSDSSCVGPVIFHRLLWSAKLRHLVTVLQQMSDVKSTFVPELLKKLEPEDQVIIPDCDAMNTKLQNIGLVETRSNGKDSLDSEETLVDPFRKKLDLNENIKKSHDILKLEAEMSHGVDTGSMLHAIKQGQNTWNLPSSGKKAGTQVTPDKLCRVNNQFYTADVSSKLESFEPVVVDMKSIEEKIILNARQQSDGMDTPLVIDDDLSKIPSPVKARNDSVKPYMAMLRDAEYLEKQVHRWEDENNPIVKVAQTMAMQISHMTQYIRRAGPITSHLGLVSTSKAVSDNARKIVKFARILVQNCIDERFCADLKSHCSLVPTVIQQLTILSNIQLGTSQADTADRILVENSQNLMKKILAMISACEAVCVKGLKTDVTQDAENAVLLALQWRRKHSHYYRQEAADSEIDELGLRRVENELPPPSLTQIFKT